MNNIKIIEVKSEFGAGTRGASLGIDAVKLASAKIGSDFFSNYPTKTVDVGSHQALFNKNDDNVAKHISEILNVENRVCEEVSLTAKSYFPIILGGDHSVGGATLSGIKKAFPDRRIGVVWIDAHADLHTPYTTPSGNMHGMPLAMCLSEDNQENAINTLSEKQERLWNEMKSVGGGGPKIQAEDIVFIALRDTEKPEDALIKKHNIKVFSVDDVRSQSAQTIVDQSLERLSDCDIVCVSFDVDSMDPDMTSWGTGTPVREGLSKEEAIELNVGFVKSEKLASWEMVEVNPLLDKENSMGEIAFEILEKVVKARN